MLFYLVPQEFRSKCTMSEVKLEDGDQRRSFIEQHIYHGRCFKRVERCSQCDIVYFWRTIYVFSEGENHCPPHNCSHAPYFADVQLNANIPRPVRTSVNSLSLEDTQVGYISQKYTLDKNTLEKIHNLHITSATLSLRNLAHNLCNLAHKKIEESWEKVKKKLRKS